MQFGQESAGQVPVFQATCVLGKGFMQKFIKTGTPRPGLEPGSKAPQASRMSTTPPGHGGNLWLPARKEQHAGPGARYRGLAPAHPPAVHKVHKFHSNTVPIGKEHIDKVPRSEDKNPALQTGEKNSVNGCCYQAIFLSFLTVTTTVAVILLPLSSTSNSPVL